MESLYLRCLHILKNMCPMKKDSKKLALDSTLKDGAYSQLALIVTLVKDLALILQWHSFKSFFYLYRYI